jgi:peptide/nickel transport system ATP-binding protein
MGVIAETADRVAVMYAGHIVELGPVSEVVNSPSHPYTRGLMGCIPRVDVRLERLAQIDGAMPRLTDAVSGCAFHPRCPQAMEHCTVSRPLLRAVSEDSQAACWLYAADAAGGRT